MMALMLTLILGCIGTKPDGAIGNETTGNRQVTPEYLPVVDMAKSDLAGRLSIVVEQVRLVKQEKKDWPDTSLGFPEKGKAYAQVITPGFVIILEANGRQYEYHSDYKRVAGPGEISK